MSKEPCKESGKSSTPKRKKESDSKKPSEKKTDDTSKTTDTLVGGEGKQKAEAPLQM